MSGELNEVGKGPGSAGNDTPIGWIVDAVGGEAYEMSESFYKWLVK